MRQAMKFPFAMLVTIACLVFAPSVFAQGQQSQQSQQSQQQSTAPQQTTQPSLANPLKDAIPPTQPPVDPKEQAAFQAFTAIPSTSASDDAQIKAGEDFVKTYPQSRYLEPVYARLSSAYLDKHDDDKMCAAADKALALNPNDITVLIPVGEAIPRSNPKSPDYVQRLAKGEMYERHALDVLDKMNKPANLTDEQFNQTKTNAVAEAHSGLGLTYFVEQKFDQSSDELNASIGKNKSLDATNYFVLGLDMVNLKKYPDAVKAFDSCTQIPSAIQGRCKKASDETKAKEGAAPKQ